MLALTQCGITMKTINLTRFSFFTRLISPVFISAINATQSAAVTPQELASISSLSTSNSLQPNVTFGMEQAGAAVRRFFTFGMEHADAAVQFMLRPEKMWRRIPRGNCPIRRRHRRWTTGGGGRSLPSRFKQQRRRRRRAEQRSSDLPQQPPLLEPFWNQCFVSF
jgi:hypothetical protein